MNFEALPPPRFATKEGWASFIGQEGSRRPQLPARSEWEAMSEEERDLFDWRRLNYHGSFGPIRTPTVDRVMDQLMNRAMTNLGPMPGARPGAIIDGCAGLGKTTILAHFGRRYERLLRKRGSAGVDDPEEVEWHPVVYHTLAARTTVKDLNSGIARFYGAVEPRYANTSRLTEIVVEHAQRCGTTLFLIDDIHYLKMRQDGAKKVNDHLKKLANETSATFVYAGIDCLRSGLLTEGEAEGEESFGQTRGRFARLPVEPFEIGTDEGSALWLELVKGFERELVLFEGYEGMCISIARYLYERTGGYIGSLSSLVRQGANKAVTTGEERITKRLLEDIELDYAAETRGRPPE